MTFAIKLPVKLAMAISPMIGEEETQRQQEDRTRRQREQRAKSRAQFREHLAASVRKTFVFLFAMTVILYVVLHGERFQGYTGQLSHKLSAKINSHNALKQNALQHEEEVDQVLK